MSQSYFVEILNSHGDVQRRERFTSLPIRIGRGYRNDLILSDPHTAGEHAIIEMGEVGDLIIRDLGSNNGLHFKKHQSSHFLVDSDKIFRLGKTLLRIRTDDYRVEKEVDYSAQHHHLGYWPQAIIALVLTCVFTFLDTWLRDIEKGNSSAYFTAILGILGVAVLWAGMFSLANRVFGGATNFSRHLLILCVSVVVVALFDYVSMLMAYSFSLGLFERYGAHIKIAVMACMLYAHLHQISPHKQAYLKLICLSMAVVSSGLLLLKNHQNTGQFAEELYSHVILPPALRISRNHTVEEFVGEAGELKTQLDQAKKEVLAEKQAAQ